MRALHLVRERRGPQVCARPPACAPAFEALDTHSNVKGAMNLLDLFCGCGGLSHGISLARYQGRRLRTQAGLDNHRPSIETFALNHPGALALEEDIRKVPVERIAAEVGDVDVIVGGPSCQGFSTHGRRLIDDERNFLYKYFMEFVGVLRPRWVLMENVTGLLRYQKGRFRDEIVEDFRRLGYAVSFAQLQAADYGVPQVRKRVFFVANRLGVPFHFPTPTHCNPEVENLDLFKHEEVGTPPPRYVTLRDAIGDLPRLGLGCSRKTAPTEYAREPFSEYQKWVRQGEAHMALHFGRRVPEENLQRISHIPQGGDWLDIPEEILPERFSRILKKDATTLFYRLRWDRPAYTITTVYRNVSSGAFTHPDEDRALTHREAARIQSFPDGYRFSEASVPRQIGNAVPPLLAKVLGHSLLVHDSVARQLGRVEENEEFAAFEQEVREREREHEAPRGERFLRVRLEGIEDLRGHDPPLSDEAWTRLARELGAWQDTLPSQVSLRGIVNGLLYYQSNGQCALDVPNDYCEGVTLARVVEDWDRKGLLKGLKERVRAGLMTCQEAGTVSELGGETAPPKRKRTRSFSTHHFATILYPVDPSSLSTLGE
jgi:DNA (cytosine-5)-methyltransferase 1